MLPVAAKSKPKKHESTKRGMKAKISKCTKEKITELNTIPQIALPNQRVQSF